MNLGKQSQTEILKALKEALGNLPLEDGQSTLVSDIHLQPVLGAGELYVFDDDDNELAHTVVAEWTDCVPEDFYAMVEQQLRPLLEEIDKSDCALLKPYSFVLVDDEHETVSELLLVDDDTMLLNDSLLKGLDEELDAFLKQLLEE